VGKLSGTTTAEGKKTAACLGRNRCTPDRGSCSLWEGKIEKAAGREVCAGNMNSVKKKGSDHTASTYISEEKTKTGLTGEAAKKPPRNED